MRHAGVSQPAGEYGLEVAKQDVARWDADWVDIIEWRWRKEEARGVPVT